MQNSALEHKSLDEGKMMVLLVIRGGAKRHPNIYWSQEGKKLFVGGRSPPPKCYG